MSIIYRPSRPDELDRIDALVVSSINDLTERHGFGSMASRSPPNFQTFCLADDPRGLWTAEDNGEPVGFAWSWACEGLWFLAQLFVKPDVQSHGIGRELLERTLEHADRIGAVQRALITFAFNTVSQGLYIRHGFAPRFPIYSMRLKRERLGRDPRSTLNVRPLNGSTGELSALGDIDRKAIGASREKHHELLMREPEIRAIGLYDDRNLVGYAYISGAGHIGPLAVASPDLLAEAFEKALELAAEGTSENVSCFVPGSQPAMLRAAMGHGFRIVFPMLMMSTGDIGGWPSYLPRNPGFM